MALCPVLKTTSKSVYKNEEESNRSGFLIFALVLEIFYFLYVLLPDNDQKKNSGVA